MSWIELTNLLRSRDPVVGTPVSRCVDHAASHPTRAGSPSPARLGGRMRLRTLVNLGSLGAIGGFGLLVSCTPDQALIPSAAGPNLKNDDNNGGQVLFGNYSVTPALVKNVMSDVQVYTLLSSDDTLKGSPNFVFGGSADGAGLWRN